MQRGRQGREPVSLRDLVPDGDPTTVGADARALPLPPPDESEEDELLVVDPEEETTRGGRSTISASPVARKKDVSGPLPALEVTEPQARSPRGAEDEAFVDTGVDDAIGGALDETVVAGRYRIEEPIGEGGMGRVFRARHRRLGKSFALKLMRTAFSGDQRARENFYREARLASSLSHPNIVSVIDFGEDPRLGAFMVMELLDGEPLSMRLRGDGRFPLKLTCEIVQQVAEALHYIHQQRVVHCDIKPDNILLCPLPGTERRKFAVKLLDFGLARVGTGSSRLVQLIDGTPEYMSPERIRGHSPQPSMDIYGLGVLCYEMLTGRLPFRGTVTQVMDAHIRQPPPPFSRYLKEPTDERAEALVMKALIKDPPHRQKDMAAFLYELRTLMDMLGIGRRRGVPPVARASSTPAHKHQASAAIAFDMCPLPMAGFDTNGTIVVANPAFARFLTGEKDAQVEGLNVAATRLCEVHPGFAADLRHVHVQGKHIQQCLHLLGQDGSSVTLMMWMVPAPEKLSDLGEVHITIHSLDIPLPE